MVSRFALVPMAATFFMLATSSAIGDELPKRSFSEKLDLAGVAKGKFVRSCASGRLKEGFADGTAVLKFRRASFHHDKGVLYLEYMTAGDAPATYEIDYEIPTSGEAIRVKPNENGIQLSCKADKNCIETDWRVEKGKWQRGDTDELTVECSDPFEAANAMTDFQNYTAGDFNEAFPYENSLRAQFKSIMNQVRQYGGLPRQSKLTVRAEYDSRFVIVISSRCDGIYELLFNGSEAVENFDSSTAKKCSYRFIDSDKKEELSPIGLYNDHMYQLDALVDGAYEILAIREIGDSSYIHFFPTIDFYGNIVRQRTKTKYKDVHFLHGVMTVEVDRSENVIREISWGVAHDKERESWVVDRWRLSDGFLGPNEGSYTVSENFAYIPKIDTVVLRKMEMSGSPNMLVKQVGKVGYSISLGVELLEIQPTQADEKK